MRVVTIDKQAKTDMGAATPLKGWNGGDVKRFQQMIIPNGDSDDFKCSVVSFTEGSTTGWHVHDHDQILVVTAGEGIVADDQGEYEIKVGDVVHIKAGDRHWHGAKANTTMAHITIQPVVAKSTFEKGGL